jgi:hypothetical protein
MFQPTSSPPGGKLVCSSVSGKVREEGHLAASAEGPSPEPTRITPEFGNSASGGGNGHNRLIQVGAGE